MRDGGLRHSATLLPAGGVAARGGADRRLGRGAGGAAPRPTRYGRATRAVPAEAGEAQVPAAGPRARMGR